MADVVKIKDSPFEKIYKISADSTSDLLDYIDELKGASLRAENKRQSLKMKLSEFGKLKYEVTSGTAKTIYNLVLLKWKPQPIRLVDFKDSCMLGIIVDIMDSSMGINRGNYKLERYISAGEVLTEKVVNDLYGLTTDQINKYMRVNSVNFIRAQKAVNIMRQEQTKAKYDRAIFKSTKTNTRIIVNPDNFMKFYFDITKIPNR